MGAAFGQTLRQELRSRRGGGQTNTYRSCLYRHSPSLRHRSWTCSRLGPLPRGVEEGVANSLGSSSSSGRRPTRWRVGSAAGLGADAAQSSTRNVRRAPLGPLRFDLEGVDPFESPFSTVNLDRPRTELDSQSREAERTERSSGREHEFTIDNPVRRPALMEVDAQSIPSIDHKTPGNPPRLRFGTLIAKLYLESWEFNAQGGVVEEDLRKDRVVEFDVNNLTMGEIYQHGEPASQTPASTTYVDAFEASVASVDLDASGTELQPQPREPQRTQGTIRRPQQVAIHDSLGRLSVIDGKAKELPSADRDSSRNPQHSRR